MIDLHCHTKVSDNTLTIREVIELARNRGVTHLAITDHDTTKGVAEACQIGLELGVEIIPGIEISAYDFKRKTRAHILGLFVEPGHSALEKLCDPMVKKRHQASLEMIDKIIEAGYQITREQVERFAEGGTGIYKQHIMHALLENGYTDRIYGDLYKTLFSRGEKDGQPGIAYVPLEYVDATSAIQAIRRAGGIAVLAHPGQFNNYEAVPEWVSTGLQGIEVYHPSHDWIEEEKARSLAENYGLVITGGSDFHGFYGDHPYELGEKSPGVESVMALKELSGKL